MIKPMLAGKAPEFDKIRYPVLVTPKIDGIRCLIVEGKAMSRSLKPIPNHFIRRSIEAAIASFLVPNLDGEIILTGAKFNEISSAVMRQDGQPQFHYMVFDVRSDKPYKERMQVLRELNLPLFCEKVLPRYISSAKELEDYEQFQLGMGYEGVMVRDPQGPYKHGRSTQKEGYLLKVKRFEDGEARIIGTERLEHNNNPAFTGELGQTKRSSCQMGKSISGLMGALIVVDCKTGVVFNIGTGFTDAERAEEWKEGEIVKYKFQPHGIVEKPRSPVFVGRRSKEDMST